MSNSLDCVPHSALGESRKSREEEDEEGPPGRSRRFRFVRLSSELSREVEVVKEADCCSSEAAKERKKRSSVEGYEREKKKGCGSAHSQTSRIVA